MIIWEVLNFDTHGTLFLYLDTKIQAIIFLLVYFDDDQL